MSFLNNSRSFPITVGLFVLSLMAVACADEKSDVKRPQTVQGEVQEPIAPVATPTPTPTSTPTPTPTPIPAPAPTAEKPSLPAARPLTEAEKLQYLTNTDSFIRTYDDEPYPRGTGFEPGKKLFRNLCMEHDPNGPLLTQDTRPTDEYVIQPLTSARQMKDALGYQGAPLYMNDRFDMSRSDRLGIVAIAKKIRKLVRDDSMILNPRFADLDEEAFADRCGQMYKKGEVSGHVYYTVVWIRLDAGTTKESLLSRLIDTKALGTFTDPQTFSEQLKSLKVQLSNTPTLTMDGLEAGYNFTGGVSPSFSFDFSPMLKTWSDAADKVELADVPEIGSIFSNYPDRSTPAALTGGRSQ